MAHETTNDRNGHGSGTAGGREEDRLGHERAALWRRRLFEAEAGLTRFVAELRSGANLHALVQVKEQIFADLPTTQEEQEWKAVFFRGQALMERFVVRHFGLAHLAEWARSNSAIYASVDDRPKHDAAVPLQRLCAQASLYDSTFAWVAEGPEHATLEIHHCAIWDYRERARARGVPITLQAPCEYCVPATEAMITHKGLDAAFQLTASGDDRGCVWTASRPVAAAASGATP
ncbi:hypothetical protein [Nocardioides zeae]|uniref:L-2-amino-thiazoline-4-carboxylic acid hydrolase n=1 Tax=Nocardioides zeae TaxID=1457234 RepID=A0AAJ1X1X0_9ACTN|nr:hypothetical protein [Nocardioides zeae]MDQ1102997.1 hypothetical protein [Nocardioides zeae]